VDAEITADSVPTLPTAYRLAAADVVPGGSLDNLNHVDPHVDWASGITRVTKLVLCDAQTSGGLLMAVAEPEAGPLLARLRERGAGESATIGMFGERGSGRISVRR
jgi:selenide,water dikinase